VDGDGHRYVIARASCRNVGLSKVDLDQQGTGLRVFGYDPQSYAAASETFFGIEPGHLGTLPVFKKYPWLEPKEEAVDEWLLVVPKESSAFQLDLRVRSGERAWRRHRVVPATGTPLPDPQNREN